MSADELQLPLAAAAGGTEVRSVEEVGELVRVARLAVMAGYVDVTVSPLDREVARELLFALQDLQMQLSAAERRAGRTL